MIDLISYSPKYSNKQNLLIKIINKINDEYYDIQFEIDNLILTNIYYEKILSGNFKHPDIIKYKFSNINKIFFHNCYIEALKYSNINDFKKYSQNFYSKATSRKWTKDMFSHMKIYKINHTKESVKEKALLCSTKKEFIFKYPNEYNYMNKNNLTDELCLHMIILKNNYSFNECKEKALLCNTKKEFQIKFRNYYEKSWKNNWLDDICKHMIILKNNYSFNDCKNEALKYLTRAEFYYQSQNIYHISYKNNWLDDICKHMIIGNQYDYPRLIYSYEFLDNSVYVGLTKNFKIREIHRKRNKNDSVTKHIKNTNLKPKIKFLTEFIPAIEAQKIEQFYIDKYKLEGWNILNKTKAGSLGGNSIRIVEHL